MQTADLVRHDDRAPIRMDDSAARTEPDRGVEVPPTPAAAPGPRIWIMIGAVVAIALAVASFVLIGLPAVPAAPRASSVPPRIEASSADFEMVAVAEGEQLVIYLTEYIGNGPVAGARLEVTADDRDVAMTERGGGIYGGSLAGIPKGRQLSVVVTIDAGGRQDLLGGMLELPGTPTVVPGSRLWHSVLHPGAWLLLVGAFALGFCFARLPSGRAAVAILAILLLGRGAPAEAHPGHGEGEAGVAREDLDSSTLPPNSPRRLPDGSLFVPKQAQLILGIRTALSQQGEAMRATRLVGRVIGDPAASGTVQSTIVGRVELPPQGMPRVGQKVQRGDVLASVVPVFNPLDRGNIQQQLAVIDRDLVALRERAEEAVDGRSAANGNGGHGAAPQAINGAATMAIAAEIDGLLKRRAAITRVILDREGMRIPLRAPADGVIAVANAIAGQIVESRDTLYEIVDPNRVWVEASAYDPTLLDSIAAASAVTADGRVLPLVVIGHGPKLTQQAIPLLFHVTQPTMLPIGTPVSVLVRTREVHSGIILPPAAVVRNPAGQTIVWQHTGAEHFVPLLVRAEPVDGSSVAVVAGLPDNRRVVVVGADLLSQIR
ncbi:MAG: efflux RND transporter periplasmic adaptor subunit [Alphaproteobacteria bacterium]|nr:efflux RND transporter periplasmic adaptor subunit [Alphaproteobacteria bacterium]